MRLIPKSFRMQCNWDGCNEPNHGHRQWYRRPALALNMIGNIPLPQESRKSLQKVRCRCPIPWQLGLFLSRSPLFADWFPRIWPSVNPNFENATPFERYKFFRVLPRDVRQMQLHCLQSIFYHSPCLFWSTKSIKLPDGHHRTSFLMAS